MSRKIVQKSELLARVQAARQAGKSIILCHGCFDIVHPGHVRYLEFARRQGDVLVVSLTGDSQIDKGMHRPYIPQELRAENLAALEMVDLVYIVPEPTACQLLAELRPDVYVKGRECEESNDPGFAAERSVVAGYGGRVLFSSGDVVFSSSRLLEVLGRDGELEAQRLAMFCRRYDISRRSSAGLLEGFSGLHVLVIGDVVLDRYVLCDATEVADEAAMLSLSRQEDRLYVGGAGIVARHLAALGARSHLLSAAADDESTRFVRRTLEEEGVQAHLVGCRPRLPEKTRFMVETQKIVRLEDARTHPLDSVREREAVGWVASIIDRIDAVIYCDSGLGTITAGLLNLLAVVLAGRRRIVAAGAEGSRGRLLQFVGADLLCPTERNLRATVHDFERGLSSVAWSVLDQTRARQMLVLMGRKGLVAFDRQSQDPHSPEWNGRLRSEYLPAPTEPSVDVMGGGDAVLATATLTLAAGGTLMQAAYLGSAAAAIESARLGNVPVEAAALKRWLAGRVELTETGVSAAAAQDADGVERMLVSPLPA
ncbi:MAG: adenylyltransferase/cytidyltransferase family protein [Phycisphaerae bacterium]|jgi:rfaE bifunctional protein kinase chain/domain/rfaE bifunctional protein nucleotidyltransferase chain/domain